jgi:hypothetical protein
MDELKVRAGAKISHGHITGKSPPGFQVDPQGMIRYRDEDDLSDAYVVLTRLDFNEKRLSTIFVKSL